MRQITILGFCLILVLGLRAQSDTTSVRMLKDNGVTVITDGKGTRVEVGNQKGVEVVTNNTGDTTHIRIGRRTFKVIEGGEETVFRMEKEDKKEAWSDDFNPHWAGLEFGMNFYRQTDYSLYQQLNKDVPQDFMELNNGKSITVNLNIAEFAFKNRARNFGIVTGLGFSFMDFTFDQPLTIEKENGDGIIVPLELEPDGLKKSKLNLTYLTAPLMLEVKTPLRMGNSHLYVAGGVIGGLNIGAHTKYKYKNDKQKEKSNYHLNSFKYDLTGRLGFGDFCVFFNYGMVPLFEEGKGPELIPFTIGFSFPNI